MCKRSHSTYLDIPYPLTDNAAMEMPLIIEQIQCSVHCGVTELERKHRQPILIDLEIQCPNALAAQSDNLADTVDYGKIVQRTIAITSTSQFYLLESLANHIKDSLFQEFPISHIKAWIRKTSPPLEGINGSVGIRLCQSRDQLSDSPTAHGYQSEPSAFVLAHHTKLPSGKVLDLAAGNGRNSLFLATRGFSVIGVDRDEQALAHLEKLASIFPKGQITSQAIDLEAHVERPPDLGKEAYDGIVVSFYLFRPLFPNIIQALKPGGILLYETFLIDNHTNRNHPRNTDFCLQHNELLTLTDSLRVLHYQEGIQEDQHGSNSAYTARLVAQKK